MHTYGTDETDEEMIHILGGMERDRARFRHSAQNGVPSKTDELFVSGICHLIFLGLGGLGD